MRFIIQVEPSGHHFSAAEGESILGAALRQGISLPYGCRSGQCGNCAARLLDGQVDYPGDMPPALENQPENSCLPCQAIASSDLKLEIEEVDSPAEIDIRTLPCKVIEKKQLNHDVLRLYLKLPQDQRLPFLAGQYLDFILQDGEKRAFSIANAPHDDELIELHVRHVPGGEFTDYLFSALEEKTILRIQAPLGNFFLREDSDRPMILMGGGTGFAPLKGMIEHAFHISVVRPMHLYWGVRATRDLYLPSLPEQWAQQHANFSYTPVLSEPDADWQGRTGFVHEVVIADHPDLTPYEAYMSGPPVMVEAGKNSFLDHGMSPDHMFSDAFEYAVHHPRKQAAQE